MLAGDDTVELAPAPVSVRLTYAQISLAGHVAVMRRTSDMKSGRVPRFGAKQTWDLDINGCCGEIAVARYLNLFWCGAFNDFEARDVGGLVDVRACSKRDYRLILHHDDIDGVPYVNAHVSPPDVVMSGWLFAREGKLDKYWDDPLGGRAAFFVPQKFLRPMDELLAWAKAPQPC